MIMKKLVCLFLVLTLALGLYGCKFPTVIAKEPTRPTETEPATAPTEPQTTPQPNTSIRPLLYKVTDTQGHTLWLFGSIHVGYDYFYPLPDYVNEAYERSDAIAFEFDMRAFENNMSAQVEALSVLMYTDGTTIKDHISKELYEKSVAKLTEYGYYNQMLDYYKPVMWSSFLDNCLVDEMGLNSELGIDYHLLDRAYKDRKQILEVESPAFQYGMLANFSPELQTFLLEGSLASLDDKTQSMLDMETLVAFWAAGDEANFAGYLTEEEEFETAQERKLYEEYNNAMIVDRNLSMTDYAEAALKSGKEVFICVGAAHIVGPGAMAQLLAQRGYTVTMINGAVTM